MIRSYFRCREYMAVSIVDDVRDSVAYARGRLVVSVSAQRERGALG
jgi:hypothetical protein